MSFVPEWLLKLVLGYVVKWLYHKVGLDATVCHVEAAVEKVAPLTPDPNPPLSQRNDPNQSLPPERGGRPR